MFCHVCSLRGRAPKVVRRCGALRVGLLSGSSVAGLARRVRGHLDHSEASSTVGECALPAPPETEQAIVHTRRAVGLLQRLLSWLIYGEEQTQRIGRISKRIRGCCGVTQLDLIAALADSRH